MRGNQQAPALDAAGVGSIPACAGEPADYYALENDPSVYPRVCGGTTSAVSGRRRRAPWVYPRVCGGTAIVQSHVPIRQGLSPRVRGNPTLENALYS